ncbi:tudor domain-containing protein 5 isoform X2 [Paroedura picta]|uniref:tudor domain-containing protein 5 isoform X2 n=1 Tax=Paroedura picta TaxID=143630 RepID=UPI004057C5C0
MAGEESLLFSGEMVLLQGTILYDVNMSDQERLLSSLKKEVRSLLIASKSGLTPGELEKEYRSMIGEQLPFRALGYQSTMELVADMPDVVNMGHGRDGNIVLKAIADESTVGIASLVSRQKDSSKSRLPRLRLKNSLGHASCPDRLWKTQMPRSLPRRGHVPPTLPAVVKSQLKELLRSSPVLLSDFNKAFAHHFGRNFEFMHYGFFSMSEVLNAASDIITVVQTRAGSLLTLKKSPSLKKEPEKLPQSKVVIQPNNVKQAQPPTGPAPTVVTRSPPPSQPGLSPIRSAPTADTCSPAPNLPTQNQAQTPSRRSNTSVEKLKPEETPVVKCGKMKQLQKQMKTVLAQRGLGGTVSSELKEKIKTIAALHPEGLLVYRLPSEFEAHFKEMLPLRELGFLTLMEFVGALSDVLHIECKEGGQDWRIYDINSHCLADSKKTLDDDETNQNSLPGLLAPEEASDNYELPCWDCPPKDMKNVEAKLNVVTKIAKPHLGLEEPHIMQEIMQEEIPPDAVQDRRLHCLPQLESSTLVGLSVEYVISPSQFYVQFYGPETSEKLEDMMIEMRRCYASKNVADRYVIPEASIKPGHLCCVRNLHDKWWYRSIIHCVLSDQEVEVFYLDFGNMGIVPKSHLRFLKDCYANLPAQATPCCLAQMKPAMGDWTSGAILEFQRLCGLKLLVGVVDEYIEGVLHLFLCDTSSAEDIYFHDVLRLGGHAVVCRENIPSKGFRDLNPSSLYLKPSPELKAGLKNGDASTVLQDLPGTTSSELCKNEVHIQASASPRSVPEMPYLESVYLYTEIWDEDWKPLLSAGEEEKGSPSSNLCSNVAVFSSQTCINTGRLETQHSQELALQVAVAEGRETNHWPLTTDSPGSAADGLSQALEEFYVSIVHSQQSAIPSQINLDANKLLACNSQLLPELSAFPANKLNGETPSKKKEDNASRTQLVAFPTPGSSFVLGETAHNNALVFTAELQGSPVFFIPYSPSAALGASARLVASSGYFSLSQRKLNL